MMIEQYLGHVIHLTEQALNGIEGTFLEFKSHRHLLPGSQYSHALTHSWPGSNTRLETLKNLNLARELLNACLSQVPNPVGLSFEVFTDTMDHLCVSLGDDASIKAAQHTLKGLVEYLCQLKQSLIHQGDWVLSSDGKQYENPKFNAPKLNTLFNTLCDSLQDTRIHFDSQHMIARCAPQIFQGLKRTENPYLALSRMLQIMREPPADERRGHVELQQAYAFLEKLPEGLSSTSLLVLELNVRMTLTESTYFNGNVEDLLRKVESQTFTPQQFLLEIHRLKKHSNLVKGVYLAMFHFNISDLDLPLFKEYVNGYLQCFSDGFTTLENEDIEKLPMTRAAVVALRDGKNCTPDYMNAMMIEMASIMKRLSSGEQSEITLLTFQLAQRYQLYLPHVVQFGDLCAPLISMSMFDPIFAELCDHHPKAVLDAYTQTLINHQVPNSLDMAKKALFRIYRKLRGSEALPIASLLSLAKALQVRYRDCEKRDSYTKEVEKDLQDLMTGLQRIAPTPPTLQELYDEINKILAGPVRNYRQRLLQANAARQALARIPPNTDPAHPDVHKIGLLIVVFEFRHAMQIFNELLIQTVTTTVSNEEFQKQLTLIQDQCPALLGSHMLMALDSSSFDLNRFEQYLEILMTLSTLRLRHINPKIAAMIVPCHESVLFLRQCADADPKHIEYMMNAIVENIKRQPEAEQAKVTLLMFRLSEKYRISIWNLPHTEMVLEPLKKLDLHSPVFEQACDQTPRQLLFAYSILATARSPRTLELALAAVTRIVKKRYEENNFDIPISTLECRNFAKTLLGEFKKIKGHDRSMISNQYALSKLITTLNQRAEREEALRELALDERAYKSGQ